MDDLIVALEGLGQGVDGYQVRCYERQGTKLIEVEFWADGDVGAFTRMLDQFRRDWNRGTSGATLEVGPVGVREGASSGAEIMYHGPRPPSPRTGDLRVRTIQEALSYIERLSHVGVVRATQWPKAKLQVLCGLSDPIASDGFCTLVQGLLGKMERLRFLSTRNSSDGQHDPAPSGFEQAADDEDIGGLFGTCRDIPLKDVRAIVARCEKFTARGGKITEFHRRQGIDEGGPGSYTLETLRGWLKNPKTNPDSATRGSGDG